MCSDSWGCVQLPLACSPTAYIVAQGISYSFSVYSSIARWVCDSGS